VVIRYQHGHPGELVYIYVKKLGLIPMVAAIAPTAALRPGPVRSGPVRSGNRLRLLALSVDDRSRVTFSQIVPDESAGTTALFLLEAVSLFADHGVQIQRVLTDNAKPMRNRCCSPRRRPPSAYGCGGPAASDRTSTGRWSTFTAPYGEWAYAQLYRSNAERRLAFTRWPRLYNHR
jgi:hypothetical protein